MTREKFMIVGSGGRESAFARRLIEDTILYAVIEHENPTILSCVKKSGGQCLVGDPSNPQVVLGFAQKSAVDYVFVSSDEPLANGVVDLLLENGIKAIGGTKQATRIEWDKIYSIEMMKKVCPEFTPFFTVVSNLSEVEKAISVFEQMGLQIVVKPQGLTGGKGVKVMPEHLSTYRDAFNYAVSLLEQRPDEKVLLVEKLHGIEFTIMGLTDGTNLVLSPASYDYPFRLAGDQGPGTGGMGCFTNNTKALPFMTDDDLNTCRNIMQRVVDEMRSDGLHFKGVLNGGFFVTKQGIRFMEFNGRFGDPEGLNILTILKGSFSQIIRDMWYQNLDDKNVEFIEKASVIKYLVAHEYPEESGHSTQFSVDVDSIEKMGLSVFFAVCVSREGRYETLRRSRVFAVGATADRIDEASEKIDEAIVRHVQGDLDYRKDIGSAAYLAGLREKVQKIRQPQ